MDHYGESTLALNYTVDKKLEPMVVMKIMDLENYYQTQMDETITMEKE
jgi:hypothetical protein